MRNVAILMQSRTGSSLVASIFHAHGWLTGGEETRSRSYVTHENLPIRKHLVKKYGINLRRPTQALSKPDNRLKEIVAREFQGHPWVWKGDVFFAEVFKATFPDVAWIYVKRKIEDAVKSALGTGGHSATVEELRMFLRKKYDLMVDYETEWGGKVVYTTDLMRGKLDTARNAIEYAGGKWDQVAAMSSFKPDPRS